MSPVYKAFLQHEHALKRFLGRFYKRSEDIEDAAHETFLRAFAAETRGKINLPKHYLFKVAKNYALNDLARKSNSETNFLEENGVMSVLIDESIVSAEARLEATQKFALLCKAIGELPPKCRTVFIKRKIDGLRVKDIAKEMGISVSAVEKHIATGVQKCAQFLSLNGYETRSSSRTNKQTVPNVQVIGTSVTKDD